MWDPGHWNASGLQVLVSATAKRHIGFYFLQCFFFACLVCFFLPPSLTALAVLVAAVAAVVGAVAHPALGDAAVVGALKLSGRAELICRGGGTKTGGGELKKSNLRK